MNRPPHFARQQGGYALLVFLMLLITAGLFAVISQLDLIALTYGRDAATYRVLKQAKEALIGYAVTYSESHPGQVFGYLPCPDTTGNGSAGTGCSSSVNIGLLPYRTLKLPDLRDSSGNCLWYAVSNNYRAGVAAPMNWDTPGGITVNSVAPGDNNGGVATLVLAPGPPLKTQARVPAHNTCQVDFATAANGAGYIDSANATATVFTPGAAGTNDLIATITVKDIFSAITKRNDFANFINKPLTAIALYYNGVFNYLGPPDSLLPAPPPTQDSTTLYLPPRTPGRLPDITASYSGSGYLQTYFGNDAYLESIAKSLPSSTVYDYLNDPWLKNWGANAQYIFCPGGATCINMNGVGYQNAIIFGGAKINSSNQFIFPRAASARACADYFESPGGLDILDANCKLKSGIGVFGGANVFDMNKPSQDFAIPCNPGYCVLDGQPISGGWVTLDLPKFIGNSTITGAANSTETLVSNSGGVITLGSVDYNTPLGIASGCDWYSAPLPMASSAQIYFSFQIQTPLNPTGDWRGNYTGPGFTLTLADATTNSPQNGVAAQYLALPPLCGRANGSQLGYAGAPNDYTGAPANADKSAGIKAPKLALEIDTQRNNAANAPVAKDLNTHDPVIAGNYLDHFSLLFWGDAADNALGGSGDDDNSHGSGTVSHPVAPQNPPGVLSPAANATVTPLGIIQSAQWQPDTVLSSGTEILTSTAPTNFTTGDTVAVKDLSALQLSGNYKVTNPNPTGGTIPTTFSLTRGADPQAFQIQSLTWDSTTLQATLTTVVRHGLTTGAQVWLDDPPALFGNKHLFTIKVISAFSFIFQLASDPNSPAAYIDPATPKYVHSNFTPAAVAVGAPLNISKAELSGGLRITAATYSANKITFTAGSSVNFAVNQQISIAGVNPPAFNGTYTLTDVVGSTFKVVAAVNPGVYVSGGYAMPWPGQAIITTDADHKLVNNQYIALADLTPEAYNGVHQVLCNGVFDMTNACQSNATQFTINLLANPGDNYTATNGKREIPGLAAVDGSYLSMSVKLAALKAKLSSDPLPSWWKDGPCTSVIGVGGACPGATAGDDHIDPTTGNCTPYNNDGSIPAGFRAKHFFGRDGGGFQFADEFELNANICYLRRNTPPGQLPADNNHLATFLPYVLYPIDSPVLARYSTMPSYDQSSTGYFLPWRYDANTFANFLYFSMGGLTAGDITSAVTIYVRLDIQRTYDKTNKMAIISTKAYIGDSGVLTASKISCLKTLVDPVTNNAFDAAACGVPLVLERVGVPLKDVNGQALGLYYLGFTNARSASLLDNQKIIINDLQVGTQ